MFFAIRVKSSFPRRRESRREDTGCPINALGHDRIGKIFKGGQVKNSTVCFAAGRGTIMRRTRGQRIATGIIPTTGTTTTASVLPALSCLIARASKFKDFEGVQVRVQTCLLSCGIMPSAIPRGE